MGDPGVMNLSAFHPRDVLELMSLTLNSVVDYGRCVSRAENGELVRGVMPSKLSVWWLSMKGNEIHQIGLSEFLAKLVTYLGANDTVTMIAYLKAMAALINDTPDVFPAPELASKTLTKNKDGKLPTGLLGDVEDSVKAVFKNVVMSVGTDFNPNADYSLMLAAKPNGGKSGKAYFERFLICNKSLISKRLRGIPSDQYEKWDNDSSWVNFTPDIEKGDATKFRFLNFTLEQVPRIIRFDPQIPKWKFNTNQNTRVVVKDPNDIDTTALIGEDKNQSMGWLLANYVQYNNHQSLVENTALSFAAAMDPMKNLPHRFEQMSDVQRIITPPSAVLKDRQLFESLQEITTEKLTDGLPGNKSAVIVVRFKGTMKESRTILYYPQITEGKGEHSELLDYYREFSDSDPVPDPVPDLDKLLKSKIEPKKSYFLLGKTLNTIDNTNQFGEYAHACMIADEIDPKMEGRVMYSHFGTGNPRKAVFVSFAGEAFRHYEVTVSGDKELPLINLHLNGAGNPDIKLINYFFTDGQGGKSHTADMVTKDHKFALTENFLVDVNEHHSSVQVSEFMEEDHHKHEPSDYIQTSFKNSLAGLADIKNYHMVLGYLRAKLFH